ncbi:hypothetical protein HK105_207643 [Polyrhizophydium stewartii]|uniref:Nitronate monooxygenase n=1 Tax=Polyrhizophydium stewartii TaxID=2732419 RepID=A0ABR4N006_9FUNG|nr:hypothetical protein HK105_002005 [Polyrhizophydium stewartii]
MFLVSGTELVVNTCRAGVVGTFPALNARSEPELERWLAEIQRGLGPDSAPFGVNLIVHKTNKRLDGNLRCLVDHKVPLVITSLGAAKDVVDAIHSYGGLVFHDVTNIVHARKAISAGVDGIVAVTAGAGGHAGAISPFAFIPQLRSEYDGIICLAGAISDGRGVRAARALGADVAYMGTRFIATQESMAQKEYKQMVLDASVGPSPSFLPTVYTSNISGVNANFLRASLERAGLDPDNPVRDDLGHEDFSKLDASGKKAGSKAWKDIWSAGHGVVAINDIPTATQLVDRLEVEYHAAAEA